MIVKRKDLNFLYDVRFKNPVAGTLTQKQVCSYQWIDDARSSENFRHFMNRLNQRVFGNGFTRYGKGLQVLPIQENSASQRHHIHLVISRPDHIDFDDFKTLADDCWLKTRFGYYETRFEDHPDNGWMSYMLKGRTKQVLADSIDWTNTKLD